MPIHITSPIVSPSLKPPSNFGDLEPFNLNSSQQKINTCPRQALQYGRYKTSTSLSSLRPGSNFKGCQKSGSDAYPVNIEIQSVDIQRSNFTGYLEIHDLTEDYDSVSTFFEAEIIGPHHSFITKKWEATEQDDIDHWSKFEAFEPYFKCHKDVEYNPINNDFIFMRWKEKFLVPNHKLTNIDGVSFTGFYYICFQVSTGEINGFYFHPTASEKYQKLQLHYQQCFQFPEFEFR